MSPKYPNIVISGNPGVGKTTLAEKLAQAQPSMRYFDFGKEAVERGCHDGWDDEFDCHVIDYDKLARKMRDKELREGGCIIDWIHADFWPKDGLVGLVVTVTCDNTVLYDRYAARGYSQQKINENLDSEIMGEIVEENQDWFEPDGIPGQNELTLIKFKSESDEDMERNLKTLNAWVGKWRVRQASTESTLNGESETSQVDTEPHRNRRVSIDDEEP